MRATPHETSMTRLPNDDNEYGPTGLDTADLWYSSDEDTDEESDDSSCVIFLNDEESAFESETEPAGKTYSATGVRSSRGVRFSDAPPGVYRYEKPSIDCLNQLYYTCHVMQAMREEFHVEQADMRLKSGIAHEQRSYMEWRRR